METGALRDLNRWRQPSEVLSRNRAVMGGSYVSVAHRDCEKHEESFAASWPARVIMVGVAKEPIKDGKLEIRHWKQRLR